MGEHIISVQSRTRSLPSRLAIGVAWVFASIFLLGLAVWVYSALTLGSRLEHRLAALRQRGEPTTMAEAAPKPVPAALNAAVDYQSVFEMESQSADPSNASISGLTHDQLDLIGIISGAPSSKRLAQVRPLLARPSVQKALQILKRASAKPYCVLPTPWQGATTALDLQILKFGSAKRLLAAQAVVCAADGRHNEAASWLLVELRLSRHMMQQPA
ncbi:MAG: hypothetical protein ACM3VW_02060, partial [Bacteroidota bacterium]